MLGKELFIRFTLCVLRGRLSICECASFPFGFEGGMWDLIVSVPAHCLFKKSIAEIEIFQKLKSKNFC